MRKRNLILVILVLALIMCASIQPAIAYFTTYVNAKGGYRVTVGDTTKIHEKIKGQDKEVVIHSDTDSAPVYIRAKVLYTGKNEPVVSGENWVEDSDGYYYYSNILEGGGDTSTLKVTMQDLVTGEDATEDLNDGDSFSVVVIYESTPVRYRSVEGVATPYADWTHTILDAGSTSSEDGGNG